MSKSFVRVLGLCLLAVSLCVSAPASQKSTKTGYTSGSAKILGAVDSRRPFSGDRLFATLDSVGGTGTWMEWDVNGVKDPSLMEVLNPMLKAENKPEMVWVLTERQLPLLAVLLQKGAGEVLMFYELKKLDAKPEKLTINPVLSNSVVFRDYKQVSENEFVHIDKPDLKIKTMSNGFRFTYENRVDSPLTLDPTYSTKSFVEKKAMLRDYEDYFKYEYSLMLRAFVQSVRGVFNWQPWHWYMQEWNANYKMPSEELDAILSSGVMPPFFTLFKAKTARGEVVEFRTNGNGYSELLVTNP
ncbi:hypothetical protein [Fibrobacter sp. UWH1]|uniref:hypothetical protein n=1 Tax=Fibrobacter sp. UWH1 TaxID=1964354 RepID=UPI0011316A8B|nr:hypothetical protein [Fibrobacter sp. UWH1]